MTHRRKRTITLHFKPPDVIQDCKSLKCTQAKSLKSTHSHVEDQTISVWGVRHEWCCKNKRKKCIHRFSPTLKLGQRRFIISKSVFTSAGQTCTNHKKQFGWWITVNLNRSWTFPLNWKKFPTAFRRREAHTCEILIRCDLWHLIWFN